MSSALILFNSYLILLLLWIEGPFRLMFHKGTFQSPNLEWNEMLVLCGVFITSNTIEEVIRGEWILCVAVKSGDPRRKAKSEGSSLGPYLCWGATNNLFYWEVSLFSFFFCRVWSAKFTWCSVLDNIYLGFIPRAEVLIIVLSMCCIIFLVFFCMQLVQGTSLCHILWSRILLAVMVRSLIHLQV